MRNKLRIWLPLLIIVFTGLSLIGTTEAIHAEDDQDTVIDVTNYGIDPDSEEDAGSAVQKAFVAAKEVDGPVTINFPNGQYDFFPENAVKSEYYISNTTSKEENPDVTKTIGMLVKDLQDVTIEGNDSLLLFHGKMTSMVVDNSENIKVQNMHVDYSRPTTSEMEVKEVGDNSITAKVHEDSLYDIKDDKIEWTSELDEDGDPYWTYRAGNAQVFDPEKNTMRRTWNPGDEANHVEEIEPYLLKFHYDDQPDAEKGHIFTMREDIRDQVGMFIVNSKDVDLETVGMHYMHGLGVVFQFSENLTIDDVDFAPREETDRVIAGFADFLQVSGGRGNVEVENSEFSGSNDDPINVHGTHLQIVEQLEPDQVVVRFMHEETYGFDAFSPGDEIDFIDTDTLTAYDRSQVKEVTRKNDREIMLTLDQPVSDDLQMDDVVENATWTPNVEVRGNHFERVPTRGILATAWKKIQIEDNVFDRPQMSSILIADDAKDWYESGMVKDVTIRNNEFIESGNPVIDVHPENSLVSQNDPVHKNISVEDNAFTMSEGMAVDVKSTKGFDFIDNDLITNQVHMNFDGSQDATIKHNQFDDEDVDKQIELNNASIESFDVGEQQGFNVVDHSAENMEKLARNYFEDDDFENHDAYHQVELQLMTIDHFEKKGAAEKVVKHTENLKLLLDKQQEKDVISDEAYHSLIDQADILLQYWQ